MDRFIIVHYLTKSSKTVHLTNRVHTFTANCILAGGANPIEKFYNKCIIFLVS